ncbi:MAG: STAS domain-containing protein [Phycisphaerae bacterium]|nr:STAS domain-containing protein [Phycisphaerae bacterium]
MPQPLEFRRDVVKDAVVLRPEGEIDLARSPELRLRLRQEVDAKPRRLVVDLAKVTYMDSSGIATLVEALTRARAGNVSLVLSGLQPRVRSIFSISRLDTVFTIVATADDAVAAT